jgi:hypothetical protein
MRTDGIKSAVPSFQFTESALELVASSLLGLSVTSGPAASGAESKRVLRFPSVCREQVSRWQGINGVRARRFSLQRFWRPDAQGVLQWCRHLRLILTVVESFNLFNHQNMTELEATGYSLEPGSLSGTIPTLNFLTGLKAKPTALGRPLNINATNFYRERQMQIGLRMRF